MGQAEARAELERIRKCGQDRIHDAVDYETLDSVLEALADGVGKDPLPIFVKPYRPAPKETDQEARGEVFGVGDIVEFNPSGAIGKVVCVEKYPPPVSYRVKYQLCEYSSESEEKYLKLIFPASRIPKELDSIRCEPKGDVVELKDSTVGMVLTIIPPYNFPYWMLTYDDVNNVWYTFSFRKENLARVIWPCKEVVGEG